MVVIGLWALFGWLIGSIVLMTQEPLVGLLSLLLGWIPMLLALIFARLMLEFYVAMARTAQNTAGTRVELERIRSRSEERRVGKEGRFGWVWEHVGGTGVRTWDDSSRGER